MATTTNYSWSTPDDTALVKDGAAAIRTLGSSADTTVKALNPGTTAGDIDYYTTSTAKARVGIGTAGQVLQVNSGATAPEWATPSSGGMTLLSTTSLTGATTTISAISGSYVNLVAFIYGVTNATNNGEFRIAVNGSTTGQIYTTRGWDNTNGSYDTGEQGTYFKVTAKTFTRTDATNFTAVTFFNYASASHNKVISAFGRAVIPSISHVFNTWGSYNADTAITSLVFSNSGGNLSTGTVLLYGVK
jgi:hypothetical protein